MWLIDWILEMLFGNSKNKTLILNRRELEEKIREKEGREIKEAERQVFSKVAEIKHLINEAEDLLAKIKKADVDDEGGNTRLRKVVSSSKTTLIYKFSGMLEKIKPPSTMDFSVAWNYVKASRQALAKEIIDMRKSIAYTGIILKDEMRELGGTFEEIEKALAEADSVMIKTGIDEIGSLKESIAALDKKIAEGVEIERQIEDFGEELKSIEEAEKKELNSAERLKESHEMDSMNEMLGKKSVASRKKQELKGKLIEKLGTVDKPLQRFSQLVESGKHILEKGLEDALRLYMTNPFIAIKRDPKGEELKKILQEVRQLVENGGITLKDEREKEKKLEALENLIEFNFFDEIFWEMNKAEAELNRADKELSGMKVYSEISGHEDNARKRNSEINEKREMINSVSERRRGLQEQVQKLKMNAEEMASKFFGQTIILKLQE